MVCWRIEEDAKVKECSDEKKAEILEYCFSEWGDVCCECAYNKTCEVVEGIESKKEWEYDCS